VPPIPFDKDSIAAGSGYLQHHQHGPDEAHLFIPTYVGKGASIRGNTTFINGLRWAPCLRPSHRMEASPTAGAWLTDGLPLKNAWQKKFRGRRGHPTHLGDTNYTKHCDAVVVRFTSPISEVT